MTDVPNFGNLDLSARSSAVVPATSVAAALPDIKRRFGELGVEAAASTPDQFGAFIKSEIQKFAKLARLAGVKPE